MGLGLNSESQIRLDSLNTEKELRLEGLTTEAELNARLQGGTILVKGEKGDKGDPGDSTQEIVDARTSVTGETFNTLDERIDADINRIKEEIRFEYVDIAPEFVDSTSHMIENTVDGRTVDMVVKGKTLKNLLPTTMKTKTITALRDDYYIQYKQPENLFDLEQGKTYTMCYKADAKYGEISGEDTVQILVSEASGTNISLVKGFVGLIEPKTTGKHCLRLDVNKDGATHTFGDMMILEGDWRNKEIPNYFAGIQSVGSDDNRIEILSHGKNLINPNKCKIGGFYRSDILPVTQNRPFPCFECNLQKGVNYYCNEALYVCALDSERKYIKDYSIREKSYFTPETSGLYVFRGHKHFNEDVSKYKTLEDFINNVQLEAEMLTPYEPFREDKEVIDLPIEGGLKSVGEVKDEIITRPDGAYLIQRVGRVTLDGANYKPVKMETSDKSKFRWMVYKDKSVANMPNSSTIGLYCDKYNSIPTSKTWGSSGYQEGVAQNNSGNTIILYLEKYNGGTEEDLNTLKEDLAKNPITVFYTLEKPIEHKISNSVDINLNTYKGLTYITSNETIKPTFYFKTPIDISDRVESISEKINRVEREVVKARSGLRGETFKTLDERIDTELTRITDNVELLESEKTGEPTYKIDNTVDGRTVDMVVKGRTLQNIAPIGEYVATSSVGSYQLPLCQLGKTYTAIGIIDKSTTSKNLSFFRINTLEDNKTIYSIEFRGFEGTPYDKLVKLKFTVSEELNPKNAFQFYARDYTPDTIIKIKNIMILEGDWTNKELPSYFEGVKSVGEEENKIELLSTRKNLFDKEDFERTAKDSGGFITKTYKFKPNTQYTLSSTYSLSSKGADIFIMTSKEEAPSTPLNGLNKKRTITTTDGTVVIQFRKKSNSFPTWQEVLQQNVQLEEASSPTLYESYKDDKTEILLPIENGLKGIQGTCDEIVKKEDVVYLIQRIEDRKETGEMYKPLSKPVEHRLEIDDINLNTFEGTTHITSNNVIKPTLDFKCLIDKNKELATLRVENEELVEKNKVLTEKTHSLEKENVELKNTNNIQDDMIDTTMLATDEMFCMLDSIMGTEGMSVFTAKGIDKVSNLYVAMIHRGLKTLEEVPLKYKDNVERIIESLKNS